MDQETLKVLITGTTWSEKTFLDRGLGNAACRNGFKALYKRMPRLLTDLAISKGDGNTIA
ncbi:MAG: ATP-binding protein [Caulobacteraceae bacterium]